MTPDSAIRAFYARRDKLIQHQDPDVRWAVLSEKVDAQIAGLEELARLLNIPLSRAPQPLPSPPKQTSDAAERASTGPLTVNGDCGLHTETSDDCLCTFCEKPFRRITARPNVRLVCGCYYHRECFGKMMAQGAVTCSVHPEIPIFVGT
jgi:hypothetical protein